MGADPDDFAAGFLDEEEGRAHAAAKRAWLEAELAQLTQERARRARGPQRRNRVPTSIRVALQRAGNLLRRLLVNLSKRGD